MRVIVFLALFGLSVAGVVPTQRPCFNLHDTKYRYLYKAVAESGIPGTSAATTGIKLSATVLWTISNSKEFGWMMLEEAMITSVSPNLSSTVPFTELTTYNISFKLSNGSVVEIYPEPEETEEILNIKRGIISAFQVTLADTDGTRIVEETDVLGTCETKLTQFRISDNETVIKKNRDRDTCSKLGVFTILPPSETQEAKFVDGTFSAEYTISSDGVVQVATVEQNEKLTPLSADAGTVLTTIKQTLKLNETLKKGESLRVCPVEVSMLNMNISACHHHDHVHYHNHPHDPEPYHHHLHQHHATEGCMPDIKNLIEIMADSGPYDIPHDFIDLIDLMKMCNKSELYSLTTDYVQPRKEDAESRTKESEEAKKKMEKHTFFLDALAYVGTEPALDLIVDLVTTDEPINLNNSRKSELTLSLSFLPVHTTCPCLVLNRTLLIVKQRDTHMTPKLVMGAVINKVLKKPHESCSSLIDEAAKFLTDNLEENLEKLPYNFDVQKDESDRHYYDDAVHTIKALGNAGVPKTLEALKSATKNKKLQIEGRAVAVYALQSLSQRVPNKVQDITLELYSNTLEEPEIRIAAFLTFMKTITIYSPTPTMKLLKLMKSVWTEPDSYVRSFVCTYWMAIESSEDPTILYLRQAVYYQMRASGVVLVCPAADKGYFKSKADRNYLSLADFDLPLADINLPRSLPRDVMGIGLSTGVLLNEYSWLPRSVSGKVTANLFGYDLELFEVGGRSTGLQQLITHVFGPTGYLRKGTRDLSGSGLDMSEMEIDVPEDIDVSGYLKFLGQEIGWKQWVKDDLMRKLYQEDLTALRQTITDATFGKFQFVTITDVLDNLGKYLHDVWNGEGEIWHGKQNITKTARFMDVKRIVPTIIGMPLNLTTKAAAHLQLDLEGGVNYSTLSLPSRIREYFWPYASDKAHHDAVHGWIHASPKFSVMASVNLTLSAYHFEPKLVFLANATSQFTQQINADLYENYTLKVKLLPELPEYETWLLNASYTQFAEVNGSLFVLGIDKRNKTMLYEPVGSELLNITLYSNISYPNSTGIDLAPFFPLSGPANITLTLEKVDNNSREFEFQIIRYPDNSLEEGLYDIELNVVGPNGSNSAIWGYVQWTTDKTMEPPKKVVEVDLNSPPGHFFSIFYGNTTKRMDIEGLMFLETTVSNTTAYLKFNRSHFYGEVYRIRHDLEAWDKPNATIRKPIITIPEFYLEVNGSLANNTDGKTSVMLFTEGSDEPHWLKVNYTTRGLMVNISATSSLFPSSLFRFQNVSMFYILPYPLKSPICHVFGTNDTHVITFDWQKQEYQLNPACEYVLARHRHENDTFAITRKGDNVMVYINGTKYTLTPDYTKFKVDDWFRWLPYKEKHVIHVREVEIDGHPYIRLSAWAGVDIYYYHGDIQLAVNGFYMNQTAGLCGNANYKEDDDMMLPELMKFAETESKMASEWAVACHSVQTPTRDYDCSEKNSNLAKCDLFFLGCAFEAHFSVGLAHFYNACLEEASSCRSPLPSLNAYLRAAHAKQISISSCCIYGNWSNWSKCDGQGLQVRKRNLLYNEFRESCVEIEESRVCESKEIDIDCVTKEYDFHYYGAKWCKSKQPMPKCHSDCIPTYKEIKVQFECIEQGDSEEKFPNVSPITLHYKELATCKKRVNPSTTLRKAVVVS